VASVVVYAVPDPRTGDQAMAAIELDAGATFDPVAFGAFLAEQPDLGTKWAPRFVRAVTAIPLTATGKVDRKPLRAEGWGADDPIWWRPAGEAADAPYRPFTTDDAEALRQAFTDAGRAAVLEAR
jgi:fatty-acyl-CoA synthase